MRQMYKPLFVLILLLGGYGRMAAQNLGLSYQEPDSFFVCGEDTLSVSILNWQSQTLVDAQLSLNLPAGITYVPGSVSGATELNIGNLQAPVFRPADVLAGGVGQIRLVLHADCSVADALNAGQVFNASIVLQSSLGQVILNDLTLAIETGLLLIQSVTPTFLSGEKGDTLFRTICIQNTRLGPIGAFYFEDNHAPGIDLRINTGQIIQNTGTQLRVDFDENFISNFGDGDAWLELGEQACFTETIIITDCGTPAFSNNSTLRIGWGCGDVCQYDSLITGINILSSTKVPELRFQAIWNPPIDYCGQVGANIGVQMVNFGQRDAQNVLVKLTSVNPTFSGMMPGTFRIEKSGEIILVSPILNVETSLCGKVLFSEATILVPLVQSGDTLTLWFDAHDCVDSCNQILPVYRVEYFYPKPCPVNGFVSDALEVEPDPGYYVSAQLQSPGGVCFVLNETYPLSYQIQSKRLTESYGFLTLRFNLPPGLLWSSSCLNLLAGQTPIGFSNTPLADHSSNVSLVYKLPLPSESVVFPFCVTYVCDSNMVCQSFDTTFLDDGVVVSYEGDCTAACLQYMTHSVTWQLNTNTEPECAINVCGQHALSFSRVNCLADEDTPLPGDSVIPYPVASGIVYQWLWDAYRLNRGYTDQNDDRKADNFNPANSPGIRQDRFLYGDTIRYQYQAVVDSGGGWIAIPRYIFNEVRRADFHTNDCDSFDISDARIGFVDAQSFRYLRDSVVIHYGDGTQFHLITRTSYGAIDKKHFQINQVNSSPPVVLDEFASMRYLLVLRLDSLYNLGLLPKESLSAGDSIWIYSDFKLDFNFTPGSDNAPDPPLVGFRTALTTNLSAYISPNINYKACQYSGYTLTRSAPVYSIKPCENATESAVFRYRYRIARSNMFPYEVRPLAAIDYYRQSKPNGINLTSATLRYLALQDSINILQYVPLPFSQTADAAELDFDNVFAEPVDEGFMLGTKLVFGPDCHFDHPEPSKLFFNTRALQAFKPALIQDSLINNIGFYSNTPLLAFNSNDTIQFLEEDQFTVDFSLQNQVISPAAAMWINVQSANGETQNMQLQSIPQGQVFTPVNGIFNIGGLSGFNNAQFRLTGENNSCTGDSLLILFGWSCGPVQELSDANCFQDTFVLHLRQVQPELELAILQQPPITTLCQASDYYEFEIFNAKDGYAYDVIAGVSLPVGMYIVPGSAQIAYPVGAAYIPIGDPAILPGNMYRWTINDVQSAIAANGLPGIDHAPAHGFRIRFKTLAECGFVANSLPLYQTQGLEPCGQATNVLTKPGMPIAIQGLNPSYGVQINLSSTGGNLVLCGGEKQFSLDLVLLGQPSAGDSVFISMPQGVSYVPSSYIPGINAPTGAPTQTNQGFKVALPLNVGPGTPLSFRFSAAFDATAGCADVDIVAQTRITSQVICASTGQSCSVYVATGETRATVTPQHPILSVENATLQINATDATVFAGIKNSGTVAAQGLQLEIYRDIDENGVYSSSDAFVMAINQNDFIEPGGLLNVTAQGNIGVGDFCDYLVVIPGAANCACDDAYLPVQHVQIYYDTLRFCDLQTVTVGVPAFPGYQYQWLPADAFSCADCPNSQFTPPSDLPAGGFTNLQLIQDGDICDIQYDWVMGFGYVFDLNANVETICAGETVSLLASSSEALTYTWQGPGVLQGQTQQLVQPAQNAVYTLVAVFSDGCVKTDSLAITVLASDTLTLPDLLTCEGEPVQILGQWTDQAGDYTQRLIKSNGCDSLLLQRLQVLPKLSGQTSYEFCAGDTLVLADTILTQSGQYCRTFAGAGANGCDSVHCVIATALPLPNLPELDSIYTTLGQDLVLQAPPAYTSYQWTPNPPGCNNCQSATFRFDSAGVYTVRLSVSNENGCGGTVQYRIIVYPPCNAERLNIPNAFSPNGDGVNEVFRVVPFEGVETVGSLTVFNRWGQKVYENTKDVFWDGVLNGQAAASDVYIYVIDIVCPEGRVRKTGEVTLLR